jgi:dephospho-CoA kinase
MIIGICGKSGSGKSSLANKLKEINPNIIHLDIDKVGHKVLTFNNVQEELVKTFGESIIDENIINRKKLGEIVFASRLEMSKLSDITWKYMQIEIDRFLSDNSDKIIILDYLLLPITKYFDMCDYKILLDVPYEIRKKRAMERDNIASKDFDLRESSSINLNPKKFDCVLKDNNDIKRLVKLL